MKETDAIFQNVTEAHRRAARSEETLRLSCDAKAPVLIGPFSRGGKSRRGTRGVDHDFKPWGKLTPFGIFLPDQKELNFYFTSSKVTSDFIADRLEQWWQGNRQRYPGIRKLLLDLDNGPENHSHRSQFIYRLGNGQWDIPALRTLLEQILPQQTVFNDYEVTHTFEQIGFVIPRLNYVDVRASLIAVRSDQLKGPVKGIIRC